MSSVRRIISRAMSTVSPGATARSRSTVRQVASVISPAKAGRLRRWKAGWMSRRCSRHSGFSLVSNPSPVSDSTMYLLR